MVSTVLNFTIAANTSSAEAGAKRVGAAFDHLGGASTSLATKFEVTDSNANKVARSLGVELSSATERTVAKLEGLRDHLVRTGAPAADMQRVTEALAKADEKYAASLSVTTQRMGFWEANGTKIAATAGAMGAAVLAFGAKSVSAFAESQKIMAQTDAVLKSTGGSAGVTKDQVLGLASALSKVTPFDDEVIQQGENLLLTFTNIGKDVFPRAIESALDLATALGIDVVTASKMLGKALDQPAEGLGALSKATGKFTEEEQKAIKEMAEFGDVAGAQALILDKLDEKFGLSARSGGKVFEGQIKILRTELGNLTEDIGKELEPTLTGLMKTFPNLALAAVGLHDAWGDLGISGGDLLIAIPLMKTAFTGFGATLTTMVAASGPIGLTIAAIGLLSVTVYLAITALHKFSEAQIATVNANINAMKATEGLNKKAAEYGITLQKGNETQEQYNSRLFQAIVAHEKLQPKVEAINKVVKSHVITLQEQIDKQKALVERLSQMEGKSEELTQATAKLDAMLRKQAEGAEKVHKEAEKVRKEYERLEKQYASTTGKIVLEIKAIEQDIAAMAKSGMSSDAMTEARHRLSQKTLELIASQSGHKEILEKTTVAFQENSVKALGNMTAIEQLEIAWKEYIDQLHAGARAMLAIPFDPMIANVETLNEAVKRADEGAASWEKLNEMIRVKTPESLKPAKQGFDDMSRQVSTVVTDLGKGIADAIVKWEGFGSSMIKIAREFGSGILRTMIETWFKPLEGMLQKVATKLTDVLGGALSKIGGAFGNLFKSDSLLGGLVSGGIMAGIGAGAAFLSDRLTRRGREKTTATGAAEELSSGFWEGTFKDVQEGRLNVDQGLAELNASWDKYVAFLNATLKDQTVIQRSIEGQRATLTEGTAALEAMRKTLDDQAQAAAVQKAVQNLEVLGAQFIETGKMSDEFAKAVTDAGGSVEAFNKVSGEIQRLQGLRNELGSLKQMIDSLLPKQKSWQEEFFETGHVTQELAAKVRAAGGDIEQFIKFGQLRGVKTRFQELTDEFNKTGVVTQELVDLMTQFGDRDTLRAFDKLQKEAKDSGKTIGELAKGSETSAAAIQAAFDSTSGGIEKAMTDAAKTLSDTLQKMDENLSAAIASLQTAMVTMIKDLVDVLLDVPGAAEKAAKDANFFLGSIEDKSVSVTIRTSLDDAGLRELEARIARLDPTATGQLGKFTDPGEGRERDKGIARLQTGTDYVPRTGLAIIHQGEAIIPASQNHMGALAGGATYITVQKVVTDDPLALVKALKRLGQTNKGGGRISTLKALKLEEPGKF